MHDWLHRIDQHFPVRYLTWLLSGVGLLLFAFTWVACGVGGPAALVWANGDEDGGRTALNYLNGRVTSIAAGTNEMQRNGIGERVLGLPREPSFDTNKPFSEVLNRARNWDSKVG